MNNEIKEILDYFKRDDKNNFGYNQAKILNDEQAKLLLDYITNLQQSLKDMTDINLENEKELTNLQQENERLKEQVNENKVIVEYAIKPSFTTRKLKDYKTRCEKASEYFKYQLENLDFYEDTKARMLCAMGIILLQNGSDSQ